MFTLNCRGKIIKVEKPLLMGILNINDDSFYAGSRYKALDAIATGAKEMISEGADILDIGGQSTRPGSTRVSEEDELGRVMPVIEMLAGKFGEVLLSIDTYYASVAREAVNAGTSIVNDISAGEMDQHMVTTAASLEVPYICMHMKGVPETMHRNISYKDLITEVLDFFIKKIDQCRQAGIKDIIIDPGFGFGKTIRNNFYLLKNMAHFKMLQKPIMAGVSRKSMIYRTLDKDAENALNGTTVLNTIALLHGANILRVHDIKEAKEAILLTEALAKA
jgi:dihydropteroate synthase